MSDSIILRETIRARGAAAFEVGRGVDDHGMNPGSAAIRDWQFGWHTRRIQVAAAARRQAGQLLEAA